MEQNNEITTEQLVNENNQLRAQLNIQVATNQKIQQVVGEYVSKHASLEVSFEHMKQYAQSLENRIAEAEEKPKRVYPTKPKSSKTK